jgi:hypothetical protein
MKRTVLAALALICAATPVAAQTLSADDLTNRLIHSRAVEAVIWGMPAVNYDLMLQEMLTKTTGKVNQMIYWGRPLDWKNQTLTPNPDTLYLMSFLNTKDIGPIVIEIPPAGNGSLNANIVNVCPVLAESAGHGWRLDTTAGAEGGCRGDWCEAIAVATFEGGELHE